MKTVNLAEPKSQGDVTSSKGNMKEIVGVRGEQLVQAFEMEELRVDNLKIEDYRRMMDNDGQVQMIWNALTNTILQAGITLVDDESLEDAEEDSEPLKFIKENLLSPKSKGGMTTSLNLVNRTFLRAFAEGYRISEVVWRLDEDGRLRLDKVLPRDGKNDRELKIIVNENGEFVGIRQRLSYAGKYVDRRIYNTSQYRKLHKTTFGEEFGSLYGRSGLRAGWYHYDKAHKSMYLNGVGHELGIVKPRIFSLAPGVTEEMRNAILSTSAKIHVETTMTIPKDTVTVDVLELTDAKVMEQGVKMINFHYSALAKSVLAQFIDLGSSTSESGSRALGESQVDFFKEGLQAIASVIIEDTWNEIIADLVKANFGDAIIPRLIVNPISNKTADAMYALMLEITKKGLPDELTKKILANNADALGLDISEDDIEKSMVEKQDRDQQNMDKKIQQTNQKMMVNNSDVELNDDYMDATVPEMARELYPDELKVKIPDIKRKLDMARDMSERILSMKLNNDKDRIINQFKNAMRNGRKAIGKVEVQLAEGESTYREELVEISTDTYEYGKRTASNELNRSIPSKSAKAMGVDERVNSAVDEQEARLKLRLSGIANDALDNNIPENEAQLLMEQEYDSFWSKTLVPTVGFIISKMFNLGRSVPFTQYASEVFAYRYTAVLDGRTTEYCKELDGRVFQYNDPNYALLTPPQHFGCRSFWTPILYSEAEGIEVEGKPSDFPVYSSVSTFKDL